MPSPTKTVSIEPLSGALDLRTPLGAAAFGDLRFSLNASMNEHKRRCRRSGWKKALEDTGPSFVNQDLHDQLLYQQLYYDANSGVATVPSTITGYGVSSRSPAYDVEYDVRVVDELGEFCGYAPEFYSMYGTNPDAAMGVFIHDSFIGYPYTSCQSAAIGSEPDPLSGDVPYNDIAYTLTTTEVDGELEVDLFEVFPKLVSVDADTYYGAVDLFMGPFDVKVVIYAPNGIQADDQLRILIDDFLASDGSNGTTVNPLSAGGTVATLEIGQTLHLNVWNSTFEGPCGIGPYEGEGVEYLYDGVLRVRAFSTTTTYTDCNSGAPGWCKTSYFSLAEIGHETLTQHFDAVDYGQGLPEYSQGLSYSYTECGQMLLEPRFCREHITFLYEFRSLSGLRRLLAGTKSRVYVLSDSGGNWRILADRLGGDAKEDDCTACPDIRFRASSLGDYLILTNNADPVLYWEVDQLGTGCDLWSLRTIDDLSVLGITRAKVVQEWKGFMFLGNLEEEFQDKPNVLIWSDYNAPLLFVPGGESTAGRHEFGTGQRILRISPMGDYLYVYTDQAIYQGMLVGNEDEVFRFREVYRGANTPRYSNAFVNTGDGHIWAALDGLYVLTAFSSQPQRVEWIHKADGAIYNGASAETLDSFPHMLPFQKLDETSCENMVAFYDETRQEVWFSWPTYGNDCPNISLVLNLRYQAADIVDYGFTAGTSYTSDLRPSVRDFFSKYGVCTPQEFDKDIKEGCPYASGSVEDQVQYLVNPTEDPSLPTHPDSLCARLASLTLDELCGDCESPRTFITASASDKTLKEHDQEVFYREEFVETGVSNYFYDPQVGFRWTGDPCGQYEYVYADASENIPYGVDCGFTLRFTTYLPYSRINVRMEVYNAQGALIAGNNLFSSFGNIVGGGAAIISSGYNLSDPDSPFQPGEHYYIKVEATCETDVDGGSEVEVFNSTHDMPEVGCGDEFCIPVDFNGCGGLGFVEITNPLRLCTQNMEMFSIGGPNAFRVYDDSSPSPEPVATFSLEDPFCLADNPEAPDVTFGNCCDGGCVDETGQFTVCAHMETLHRFFNVVPASSLSDAVLSGVLGCACPTGSDTGCLIEGRTYRMTVEHASNHTAYVYPSEEGNPAYTPTLTTFSFVARIGMRLLWNVQKSLLEVRGTNSQYSPSESVTFHDTECSPVGGSGFQTVECDYPSPPACDSLSFGSVEGYYVKQGYCTMLQADANKFGTDAEKVIREVKVDFAADEQTIPNQLKAQVAWGAQSGCLAWENIGTNDLACITSRTDAAHRAANSRANLEAGYACLRRGNQIAWRFWVDAPAGKSEITGGKACFNKVSLQVRVPEARPR